MWSDDAEHKEQLTLSRDGEGTAKFVNGDTYSGQYLARQAPRPGHVPPQQRLPVRRRSGTNGLKHGQGSLTYPDKGKYSGRVGGAAEREGYGVYEYKGGDVYCGGWKARGEEWQGRVQVRGGWRGGARRVEQRRAGGRQLGAERQPLHRSLQGLSNRTATP